MSDHNLNHPATDGQYSHQKRSVGLVALVVGALSTVIAISVYLSFRRSHDEWVNAARRSLVTRDYDAAEVFAEKALAIRPQSMDALRLAAESAAALGEFERAFKYFDRIPEESEFSVDAHGAVGELCINHGYVSRAVDEFLKVIHQQPDDARANQQLAFLYGMACRNWEAVPYRIMVLRKVETIGVGHVFAVALGDDFLEDPKVLLRYHKLVSADPAPKVGLARAAMLQKRFAEARQLLVEVVRDHPARVEAQVNLGRVLLHLNLEDEFENWHAEIPAKMNDHPGLWTVRGAWAQRQGSPLQAIRCWAEAVKRDPNLPDANYQLGQLLVSTGRGQMAEPYLERSQSLRDYVNVCYAVVTQGGQPSLNMVQQLRVAAENAHALGLIWEALAWTRLTANFAQSIQQANSLAEWAKENLKQLQRETATAVTTSRATPQTNPAADFPMTAFPGFEFAPSTGSKSSISERSPGSHTIHFRNDARRTGLHFTYFNDGAPLGNGRHGMYEFTGGGVAALDYDMDGSVDLFFTQGCVWPPTALQAEHLDSLFRNSGRRKFRNVTSATGIHESGYSQGATVGDFDNDGFPDIYVANIGRNRLFHNNGDGTFHDVSETIPNDQVSWSTSCLMADLNSDSLPDIYAVNYLSGNDVFTRRCTDVDGIPQTCLPHNFTAAQDQVYLNLGNGQFSEITDESGFTVPDGKGLGIVAADFQSDGRLSLFVANDEVPNFCFIPTTNSSSQKPMFEQQALSRGLSLNRSGQAEACMGIAAGDANQDGLLDVFVTNFEHESNTLYLQRPGMIFEDATDQFRLAMPSLPMLGFGAQFLDGDLDGDLDLIVTNGHIQETGNEQMSPQFFINEDGMRFHVLPAHQAGTYFEGKYLGRGMARLDWNGDGYNDLAISHLDEPAALVTNIPGKSARRIVVRLIGQSCSRDAVGATVTVRIGQRTIVRQLTAGDGYLGSNQRLLTFGLGSAENVPELHVRWPSGSETTIGDLPTDIELLLIEHRTHKVTRSLTPE